MWYLLGKETRNCKKIFYNHHHIIIDRFAAKVGEPWILQTNLTKCFVLQKYNVTGKVLYREKIDTKKKKEKKKEEQPSHLYIIHSSVYMQHNGKKIVEIIITIIIFVANIK